MLEKNMGVFDRTIRIVLGLGIIVAGLFLLDGAWGNPGGLIVAALGLLPILAGVTGVCLLYIPLKINTYQANSNS